MQNQSCYLGRLHIPLSIANNLLQHEEYNDGGVLFCFKPLERSFTHIISNEEVCHALTGAVSGLGVILQAPGVTSSIPSQGTCQGCRPGPWSGLCQRHPINISLSHQCFYLSFLPPLSENK